MSHNLKTVNDTITELCLDSGFKSLRTFNRAFKEKFKTSPSEYRKTFVRNWNMMWCQEIGIWYDCRAHDPMIYWWDGKSEHINMTRQYMQRRYSNIWSITWYRKESFLIFAEVILSILTYCLVNDKTVGHKWIARLCFALSGNRTRSHHFRR